MDPDTVSTVHHVANAMSRTANRTASRHAGFSLVETLVCLAIAAVLLCVALPGFGAVRAAVDTEAARAALVADLAAAAEQAMLSAERVVLCPSADGERCDDGSAWQHGWIAFVDADGDRERGAGEARALRRGGFAGDLIIATSAGRGRIVFQPAGGNAGSNAAFAFCDAHGAAEAVVLGNSGRVRIAAATDAQAARCAG